MYTQDDPPRKQETDDLGEKIRAAMHGKHNTEYKYGQGSKILYSANGVLSDHATALGALAYTIELRPAPGGDGGFAPEPDQILPTAEEFYEGALVAIAHAKQMPTQKSEN